MLNNRPTYYLVVLVWGILGCNRTQLAKSDTDEMEIILPDSSREHQIDTRYLHIKNIRRELNLKDLEKGVDSFEFRLYEDGALWSPDRVFIIKNENDIWTATVITYYRRVPEAGERMFQKGHWREEYINAVVDSFYAVNIQPEIGWQYLVDSLKSLDMYHLPSQADIPDFADMVLDGTEYFFELASSKQYKFFSYHNPEVYNDQFNKRALSIIQLLSRQLTPIHIDRFSFNHE